MLARAKTSKSSTMEAVPDAWSARISTQFIPVLQAQLPALVVKCFSESDYCRERGAKLVCHCREELVLRGSKPFFLLDVVRESNLLLSASLSGEAPAESPKAGRKKATTDRAAAAEYP